MGADAFYPDNPLRQKRLKILAEQIRTSQSNITNWDQEISNLGIKITQRLKNMKDYFQMVSSALKDLYFADVLQKVDNLLNWIRDYSTDQDLSNNGMVKVSKLVIEVIFFVSGSVTGLGFMATLAFTGALHIFFGAIVGAVQRKKLRQKTKQALKFRADYKKNELRCQEVVRVLIQIQSHLQGFQTIIDSLGPVAETNPQVYEIMIKQLQIVEKLEKAKNNAKSIDDKEVRKVLYEMDKSAPYRDMEVEDPYTDLKKNSARMVKTDFQKRMQRELEERNREYVNKVTQNSAYNYYKQFMTGVEKFNYGNVQTNINKSIFALWGVYNALEPKKYDG